MKSDSHKAKQQAEACGIRLFPSSNDFALFAATKGDFEDKGKALEWLPGDKAWWLWSTEMRREVMRHLASTSGARLRRHKGLESALSKARYVRSIRPLDSGKVAGC